MSFISNVLDWCTCRYACERRGFVHSQCHWTGWSVQRSAAASVRAGKMRALLSVAIPLISSWLVGSTAEAFPVVSGPNHHLIVSEWIHNPTPVKFKPLLSKWPFICKSLDTVLKILFHCYFSACLCLVPNFPDLDLMLFKKLIGFYFV